MDDFLRFIGEQLKEVDVEGLRFILGGFTSKFPSAKFQSLASDFAAYRIYKGGSHHS